MSLDIERAMQEAEERAANGDLTGAGRSLHEILLWGDPSGRLLNDLGIVALEQKRIFEAVGYFEWSLALNENDETAREGLEEIKHRTPGLVLRAARAMKRPTVSVVIPCYKQAGYLPQAVESLIAQQYEDWECVIVDDGSPDNTAAVARQLVEMHPDKALRLLQKKNGGLSDARNKGILASRGRYILPFDCDDALHPVMLSHTVSALEGNRDASIAHTDGWFFGVEDRIQVTGPFDLRQLMLGNRLFYCSLYKREVFDASGGYSTKLDSFEDWDFWISAAERGFSAVHVPEPLFFYRTKAVSMLTEAEKRRPRLEAIIRLNHPAAYGEAACGEARRYLASIGIDAG